MEVDDEPRYVLDDATNRRNIALVVFEDNANFGAGDVQTPEPLAMPFDESRNGLKDIWRIAIILDIKVFPCILTDDLS